MTTLSRPAMVAFNRGIISPRALARVDLKRTEMSAQQQKNWMPRTLGSMALRAGLAYIGNGVSGKRAVYLPFIRGFADTALMEFTGTLFRPWVVDTVNRTAALITRVSVASAIANPTFIIDLSSWTNSSETGATVVWDPSGINGSAKFTGTGFNRAILDQTVVVAGGDIGKRHAVRIVVEQGTIRFRIGSTVGGDEYLTETTLGIGQHSLAFTPAGNFTVWFASDLSYPVFLDSCTIEGPGILSIPTTIGSADAPIIRWGQSVDVVFIATAGYPQFKVERRAVDSWSWVQFQSLDGPFRVQNTDPITITPSALSGLVTLTASRPIFYIGHIGALFRLRSVGQTVIQTLAGADQWSDPVEVSGVSESRNLTVNTTGTWVATVRLQRSVGAIGAWEDVAGETTAANWTNHVFNDTFDNDLIFYRVGIKVGEYTSGTVAATLFASNGGINGIVQVTAFSGPTVVAGVVVKTLGGILASDTWWEGLWSTYRGFPSAVDEPYEGRLSWAGKDFSVQSVSDAYASYDDTIEGDSGPIIRSIGTGPMDTVNWVLGLQRLLFGGDCREYSIRSSSLDEPLTPSNWNLKSMGTHGSGKVPAVRLDSDAIYVQKSTTRVMRLSFNPSYFSGIDYSAADLTKICPELGDAGFVRLSIQRMPDTRVHCVRGDGTAAVLVFDPLEEVQCWVELETDGFIEDVVVLPGIEEDLVFYAVLREPGAYSAQHTLELMAMESECRGPFSKNPALNKQADCFTVFSVGGGAPTTHITGIPTFLNGQQVVCWGDGVDLGGAARTTFLVTAGAIDVPIAISNAVTGLYYEAPYQSTKLAYGGQNQGTALGVRKEVKDLAIIAGVMHSQGLRYGPDFDSLDDLPGKEDAGDIDFDFVWQAYDHDPIEFNGEMTTDSRICLLAQAPRPCELLGIVPGVVTADVT